jgi:hypothetical protein
MALALFIHSTRFSGRTTPTPPRMPYVNVRITKDGVTAAQKAQLVAEITDTLGRVLGKRPEHTHVDHRRGGARELGVRRRADAGVPPARRDADA